MSLQYDPGNKQDMADLCYSNGKTSARLSSRNSARPLNTSAHGPNESVNISPEDIVIAEPQTAAKLDESSAGPVFDDSITRGDSAQSKFSRHDN